MAKAVRFPWSAVRKAVLRTPLRRRLLVAPPLRLDGERRKACSALTQRGEPLARTLRIRPGVLA